VELNARRPAADGGSPAGHLTGKDHAMTRPALTLLQAEFARTAGQQRTEEDLHMLRQSADRASRLHDAREDRAAAHAEFHSLLADGAAPEAEHLIIIVIQGGAHGGLCKRQPSWRRCDPLTRRWKQERVESTQKRATPRAKEYPWR
jgi:DNA-binding FadR family transcriptional regulator